MRRSAMGLLSLMAVALAAPGSLHEAVLGGDAAEVRRLLDEGADASAQNEKGDTPLLLAVAGKHVDVVSVLLERDADPNGAGQGGMAPLHVAAAAGNRELAELLVRAGANVNQLAWLGDTPLDLARRAKPKDCAAWLEKQGAWSGKQLIDGELAKLGDRKWSVRMNALDTLANVGPSIVSPLLLRAVQGKEVWTDGALGVLHAVGAPSLPFLLDSLNVPQDRLRAIALRGLASLPDPDKRRFAAMAALVTEEGRLGRVALGELANLGRRYPKVATGLDKDLRERVAGALVATLSGPKADVEALGWVAALAPALRAETRALRSALAKLKRGDDPNGSFAARLALEAMGRNHPGSPYGRAGRLRSLRSVLLKKALERGLDWLVSQQRPDGGWAAPTKFAKYETGVSALAALALLGAPDPGAYADAAKRAVDFLVSRQAPAGWFGPPHLDSNYTQAIATWALAEMLALTGNPIYRDPLRRAAEQLLIRRTPGKGWRYQGKESDTSVTAWAVMALRAAWYCGVPFDGQAAADALQWIDKMTDPNFGQVGYDYPGGLPKRPEGLLKRFPAEKTQSMTAAGAYARVLLAPDGHAADQLIRKGCNLVAEQPPVWALDDGSIDMYYWFFGSLITHAVGGRYEREWFRALTIPAVEHQEQDGSWPPAGPWGMYGGRVYATAVMAMSIEASYRYDGR